VRCALGFLAQPGIKPLLPEGLHGALDQINALADADPLTLPDGSQHVAHVRRE